MAVSVLYTEVLAEVLRRKPELGQMITFDSVTADAVYSVKTFSHAQNDPETYKDQYGYRYNLTGNDRVKQMTNLQVPFDGSLYHGSSAVYVDISDKAGALMRVHPDTFLGWVMEAQRRQYILQNVPLVRGHDLNMELTGVAYWDGSSGGSSATSCALAKSTTDVLHGAQSLQITASGASWSVFSEKIFVNPLRQLYWPVIARASVGTVKAQLYDVTNGALIGTTVSYTGASWAMLDVKGQTPSGCEQVQIKFSGAAGSDVAVVNTCFGPYQDGRTLYPLPTGYNERYKLGYLRPQRYTVALPEAGTYDAWAYEYPGDLVERNGDFSVENLPADLNPYNVHLNRGIEPFTMPVYIYGGPQRSDTEPMSSETATTTASLDVVADFTLLCAFEDLAGNDVNHPQYGAELAAYQKKTAFEIIARPREAKVNSQNINKVGIW